MANHPVIISYSSLDQHLAEKIALALQARNINCWVGYENIRPGESWPAAISEAINDCEIFLLILTRNSNSSRQVVRELTQADNLNKKLYCFQPDDIKISKDLLYFFSSIHRHEAFKTGFDKALKKMCDEVSLWLSSTMAKSLPQNGQVTIPDISIEAVTSERHDAPKEIKESFLNNPQEKKMLIGSVLVAAVLLIIFFFRDSLWPGTKEPDTEPSSLVANSSQLEHQKPGDTSTNSSLPNHQNSGDTSIIEKKEKKIAEAPVYDSIELARKKLSDLGVSWSNQSFANALVDEDRKNIELFLKGGMSVNAEKDGTSVIMFGLQPGLHDREWKLRLFIKYGFNVNATLSDAKIMQSQTSLLPNYYNTPLTPAGYDAGMKSFKGPLGLWLISWVCYFSLKEDDEKLIKIIAENGSRFTIEKDYLKFSESAWGHLPSYAQVSKLIAKYSK